MKQYEMFELTFTGEPPQGSEADADVEAVFTCGSVNKKVKGFYAGNGIYKVRYLPRCCGNYTWKVYGAVSGEGSEECVKGEGHGLVQAEGCHFRYEDGTAYVPFGTTIYALAHQEETLIRETMESLKTAPFNKVRHCVFPKSYEYNHNDPQYYPFQKDEAGKWDVSRPDYRFWDAFEKVIFELGEMDIQTDLILFHPYDRWGFAAMSMEENEMYLRYAIRRLSAIPYIWWSMANEYDLCFAKSLDDWARIEEIIKEEDVYGHLLSNHYCMKFYDYTRENLTHCSMQNVLFHKADKWMKEFNKPIVYDECCYEGNIHFSWGNISAAEMVHRFWCAYCIGSFATHGETYLSEDDVLWWSKGGTLKGKSPAKIAFLRGIIESLPSALEPWEEPEYLLYGPDFNDKVKDGENPFENLHASLTEMEDDAGALKDKLFAGHCGEEAFIKYYGIHCPGRAYMILPEDRTYKIEIIDTWNETRETVMEGAKGIVWFDMPGKEKMAVMATGE